MMARPEELRLQASLLKDGATITAARGDYMAERLVCFAAQDEETAQEFHTAAQQLAAFITTLKGCTADQRFELRRLATFLKRHADQLAPIHALHDEPDAVVVQLQSRVRLAPALVQTVEISG